MDEEKFDELVKIARLTKLNEPNFSVERLINFSELSDDQKGKIEKEFEKEKKAMAKNSVSYDYFENDYF